MKQEHDGLTVPAALAIDPMAVCRGAFVYIAGVAYRLLSTGMLVPVVK